MSLPIQRRDFDVFLSHAHKDAAFVVQLDRWLTTAGLRVWYDARELAGGALLATDLQAAIERCRGILLVATDDSLARGWVKAEYNAAMDQRANHDAFRVVALRLPNANVKELLSGTTWIDLFAACLDPESALSVLRAFYPGEKRPNPATSRDIFISCSWQPDDSTSARTVSLALAEQGFRLIGDARDQKGFGAGQRVERIIASCGAFVGILPFREVESASADETPYKYFIREMDIATQLNLPSVIIADPRIRRVDGSDTAWIRMDTPATQCPASVSIKLNGLWEQWREPPAPQYVFCAVDLESESARAAGPIRHLIERITGMATIVGSEVHEDNLQSAITKKVCEAFLVLADITDDNLNTCIEAGMGLAASTNVELLARGKPRRPPFMLRSLQMPTYEDDVERLAVLHLICGRIVAGSSMRNCKIESMRPRYNHAPSFFLAVRDSFLADLVISVTRFTDSTKGTLTLSSVVKHLEKSTHCDLVDTLRLLQGEIVTLSKPIKKWRHNLVARRTLKFAGASPQEPLPDVRWDQIDAVLEKLAEALNTIQAYFTNAETGYADIITHGDGDEVIRLMRLGAEAEAAQLEADLAAEQ